VVRRQTHSQGWHFSSQRVAGPEPGEIEITRLERFK
jgi:hypothetical protein